MVGQRKKKQKQRKYNNQSNIIPLSFNALGVTGPQARGFIQLIADRTAEIHNIPYSVVIHRIRTRIISKIIKHNAEMIVQSIGVL